MRVLKRLFGVGRAAEHPILVRNPDRPEEIPDATLARMVSEKLEGDEIDFHWSELRRGEVIVDLISAELDRICEQISRQCDPTGGFGREGGCGRSLRFVEVDGKWTFRGSGDWIS